MKIVGFFSEEGKEKKEGWTANVKRQLKEITINTATRHKNEFNGI